MRRKIMAKIINNKISRRDFLKGLGFAGGSAVFTLLGNQSEKEAFAYQKPEPPGPLLHPNFAPTTVTAYYLLEIEYFPPVIFSSCTNMGSTNEAIEHKEWENDQEFIRVTPGRLEYNDIILERELNTDTTMWDWLEEVQNNFDESRKTGSIIARDEEGTPIARWDFYGAWPREVSATLLPSDDDPGVFVLREHTILTVEEIEAV
jgi:phage tail-like protein